MLRLVLSDGNLATDRMSRDSFCEGVENAYFQELRPLESRRNKAVFPRATKQFIESVRNGHTPASMRDNLGFLQSEFGDYFDDLVDKKVLISDNDNPPAFRLNHNSAMVYWVVGLGIFCGFVWKVAKIFFQKL